MPLGVWNKDETMTVRAELDGGHWVEVDVGFDFRAIETTKTINARSIRERTSAGIDRSLHIATSQALVRSVLRWAIERLGLSWPEPA